VLNPLREWLSPGYLRKQATRRLNEYGQTSFLPKSI